MTMENQQAHFNHEDWLDHLNRYIETARQICNELFRGLKSLSQKGLLEAWSEIRSTASKLTPLDFIVSGLVALTGIIGGLFFLIGLCLFGYQAILWLQDGIWTEFPLFAVFNFLFENTILHQWMAHPESWLGLQKTVLMVFGVCSSFIGINDSWSFHCPLHGRNHYGDHALSFYSVKKKE